MQYCQSLRPKQYSESNPYWSGLALVPDSSKVFTGRVVSRFPKGCACCITVRYSCKSFPNPIFRRLSPSRPQPRHTCIWLLTPIPHFRQGLGIRLPLRMQYLCALQYSSRQDFPHISSLPIFSQGQMLYPLCPAILKFTTFFSNWDFYCNPK